MANVISVCNSHGGNNWLWAVWIVVDPKSELPDEKPTVRGYAESKRAAHRAAWCALKKRIAAENDQRVYFNRWANDLHCKEKERGTRPLFSRCSIGKSKWQWVVGNIEAIDASGVAESPIAAQRDAELQHGPVRQIGNWMATGFRQKQIAIQRSQRKSECESTSLIELVYECHRFYGDFEDSDTITPHRIVKRSKTRIYVDREPYQDNSVPNGDWTDYLQRLLVLDRVEFESTGRTERRRSWGYETFYASPEIYFAERRSTTRPECFAVLGIESDATVKDVKKAFKMLVVKLHPDTGGDPEEFKAVHAAYERAMAMVSSNA